MAAQPRGKRYEVEKIKGKRGRKGQEEYLIEWKDTYEHTRNLFCDVSCSQVEQNVLFIFSRS